MKHQAVSRVPGIDINIAENGPHIYIFGNIFPWGKFIHCLLDQHTFTLEWQAVRVSIAPVQGPVDIHDVSAFSALGTPCRIE